MSLKGILIERDDITSVADLPEWMPAFELGTEIEGKDDKGEYIQGTIAGLTVHAYMDMETGETKTQVLYEVISNQATHHEVAEEDIEYYHEDTNRFDTGDVDVEE